MIFLLFFSILYAGEESSWDVQNPPCTQTEASISTNEGTWMSLDISPDNTTLIFDLLGDIYQLPIAGGKATAISTGMAWDMQPQYSPDGEHITFTSDRGGGDNIWIMHTNGTLPKPITEESYRLLNSPVWSPDGQYIAARKHYTNRRSLGTGEIWLYNIDEGKGIALTKKENDQKDVGEPHFSADGKYLYFSKDNTGGSSFSYNKDPNQEIYAIFRIDLTSGKSEKVTGGSGSALRPVPSPNNTELVFVRRIRGKTHLMMRDLQTGQERSLTNTLDHDLQETWAIHGVYPMFTFDHSGENLYFWAKGKIWKYNIKQAQTTEIPFYVQDTRNICTALQSQNKLEDDFFIAKMPRGVRTSPQQDQFLYETAGSIWLFDRKRKQSTPIAASLPGFQYDAQWSKDGNNILLSTWSDTELSRIHLVSKQGQTKHIPLPKGHYREAIFTPDQKGIVVRKSSGGWIRSPLYSQKTGLYHYDLISGEWTKIYHTGTRPHFGSQEHHLFFNQYQEGKLCLMRLDLHDGTIRKIAHSKMATQIIMSPDETRIAFMEDYNAHSVSYPPHQAAIELSSKISSLPFTTHTKEGAWNLHFSSEGTDLFWTQGNTIYKDDNSSTRIEHRIPIPQHQEVAAITNVNIVSMEKEELIEKATIVWKKGKIIDVGTTKEVTIPTAAKIFDGTGLTIIPGLIDVHHHGSQTSDHIIPEQNWINLSMMSFGVTTIHDPSHNTASIFSTSEMQKAGKIIAPRIFSTGTILYGAKSRATAKINSLKDAQHHLRRLKSVGAFSVKSYNQPRRDQRQQVIEAARQENMRVMPEGGSLMMHNLTQIIDGHTGIEHAIPVAPLYEDVLQLWSQSEVGYTPTLGVGYGGLWGENYWYANTDVWDHERLNLFVPQRVLDPVARRSTKVPDDEYHHITTATSAKALADRNVSVQLGGHGQRQGLATHWEMWMLAQGGMSPIQALKAGTIDGAKYLGLEKEIGSIRKGKRADFLVLEQNPLENIRNSTSIRWTIQNGVIYDSRTMNTLFPQEKVREPLFFESGIEPTTEEKHQCGCGAH